MRTLWIISSLFFVFNIHIQAQQIEGLIGTDEYVGTKLLPKSKPINRSSLNFDVELFNFTPQAETAFHFAVSLVAPYLNSYQSIRFQAIYGLPLPGGTLGICIPNSDINFTGVDSLIWYPSALANAITGSDLQSAELDFNVFIGNKNWYTGTDGNCPSNQYDLVSVVLHELLHGLGFISLASVDGVYGKYGDPDSINFQFTTFPMPDFNFLSGSYDQFLFVGSKQIVDTNDYQNVSIDLRQALTSDSVYFSGPHVDAYTNGAHAKIYAPLNYEDGSSIHHFDETTYPAGSVHSLMTPQIGLSEVNHTVDSLALAVLADIGWMNPSIGAEEETLEFRLYPVPSNNRLSIHSRDRIERLFIIDAQGRACNFEIILKQDYHWTLSTSYLATGVYTVVLETEHSAQHKQFSICH